MDRNFSRALKLVLAHEGGWADNPKDPGGATMKGVTLANFRRYVKPGATKDDLRKITDAQVATVYRRYYWDAVAGAELPDGIDYAVFDFAVNSGPSRAAQYLQKVVGVAQDGKIGPATLKATKAMLPATVIHNLCDERLAFLKRIKSKGKLLWDTFGKGWSRRVQEVRAESLSLSGRPTPEKPTVIEKRVEVPVERPVVPEKVEQKVKEKSNWLTWLTGGGGLGTIGLGWLAGMNWQAILAGGAVLIVVLLVLVILRSQIIAAVREIKAEVGS
jgi:lysozyme family protein